MSQPEQAILAHVRARLGTTLKAKYRLEALLGVGGMAAVYSATHRNAKRVAVKILHTPLSLHADMRARFVREGYVANSVGHPGAVAVLDDDVADDGAAFLVMELLEGETLNEVQLRLGPPLPLPTVLAVARGLLDVLTSAHERSIVHRDIKPANVFLTCDGQVKVLDFGVARMRDGSGSNPTNTGLALGTPAFMAPEQALGRAEVDGRADVWAVGASMFTLLSGKQVHGGESSQETLILAATRMARSVATVRPDLPPIVVQLVDKALAFALEDRWATAAAMRDAVDSAIAKSEGGPISSPALASVALRRPAPPALALDVGSPTGDVHDLSTLASPHSPPLVLEGALATPSLRTPPLEPVAAWSSISWRADVNVRGTPFAPLEDFVRRQYPDGGWRQFLGILEPAAREVVSQSIIATNWYPFPLALNVVDSLVALADGRASVLRDFAIQNLDYATSVIFRAIFKMGSPQFMVARSDQVWKKYYSAGRMVCDVGAGRSRIELRDFPYLSTNYEKLLLHSIEAVLLKAGARVTRLRVTKSALAGDEWTEFTHEWV
ncbi:MAG TPA: serine/threonine-protein kinase [Polyangiaceae bacterium]|jgi:serine/threonine protein kinase